MSALNAQAEEIDHCNLVKQKASAPGEMAAGLKHLTGGGDGGGFGLAREQVGAYNTAGNHLYSCHRFVPSWEFLAVSS